MGGFFKNNDHFCLLLDRAISSVFNMDFANNVKYSSDAVEAIIAIQKCCKEKRNISFPLDKDSNTPCLFS